MTTLQPYTRPDVQVYEGEIESPSLSQEEYMALRDAMTTMRDLLICKMLRGTGFRINELLRCSVDQLQVNGPDTGLWVAREKKRSSKPVYGLVPLPPGLGVELKDYLKQAMRVRERQIFTVSDRQVRRVFATAGLKALGRAVHPHERRGLYIKSLIDGGLPLEATAKMVGHEDPKTTLKYYYRLSAHQIAEIQRRVQV